MDGVNLQASMHNLTQVDRLQNEEHTAPIANQDRNAQAAKEEAAKRVQMPVEPDSVEEKRIDAENHKAKIKEKRKKRKKEEKEKKKNIGTNTGRFIDFNA